MVLVASRSHIISTISTYVIPKIKIDQCLVVVVVYLGTLLVHGIEEEVPYRGINSLESRDLMAGLTAPWSFLPCMLLDYTT